MDDLILRDVLEVGRTAIDKFVWRCDDAFDRFVAAVEDRFGVRAKELKTSEEIESYGSLKEYPYFALIKDGVDTGYEISGYIKDDEDNDRLEIRYYASTTDKKDFRESFEGEDIIAWLDDKMVKKESRRSHGRMLKEDVDKKYELTDETTEVDGHTLHRIIALKDFSDVKAGDLGGWIESEKNLSQEGKCWVYDEAKVSGDAQIYGNALVRWNAEVYGNASVYGDAKVYEAKVYGNAKVYKNAEVSGDIWIHDNAQVHGFVKLDSYSSVGPLDICGNADISAFYQVVLAPKERRTLN